MKFSKIAFISLILFSLCAVAFAQDVTFDVGIFSEGNTAGGEIGIDIDRFGISLRAGGLGISMNDPTLSLIYDAVDSDGVTDSETNDIFPGEGQSLDANMTLFSLGLRGTYDIIDMEYMDVYFGTGITWKLIGLSGEFVANEEGDTLSIEGSVNALEVPLVLGVEFEPFERAPGLVFGIEGGYKLGWLLGIDGSLTEKCVHSDGYWHEDSMSADLNPNIFAQGFTMGVTVKYRF